MTIATSMRPYARPSPPKNLLRPNPGAATSIAQAARCRVHAGMALAFALALAGCAGAPDYLRPPRPKSKPAAVLPAAPPAATRGGHPIVARATAQQLAPASRGPDGAAPLQRKAEMPAVQHDVVRVA